MDPYQQLLTLFNTHLDAYRATVALGSPRELYEPEDYILSLGGKRLRPLLALMACDLFDKDPRLALDTALAVELFHNFSLIHDDILDAAPLRRGKATVHHKWNNNIAILSGDVMLVKAAAALNSYDAATMHQLSALFLRTAVEVCEGQQEDMNFENSSAVTIEDYIGMITRKTAVLLGCSLQMGAIAAGASTHDQHCIYRFGKHLGIAFQLLDDYLDAFARSAEKFGKQPGGDILANKKTWLLINALDLASTDQKHQLNRLLHEEKDPSAKVQGVLAIFTQLQVGRHCLDAADQHTQIAIAELEKISGNTSKKVLLRDFALGLLKRDI